MNAIVDYPVKPEARPYLDAFDRGAADGAALAGSRRSGMARFAEAGFPSRKSENWRYLDLQPLDARPAPPRRRAVGPSAAGDGRASDRPIAARKGSAPGFCRWSFRPRLVLARYARGGVVRGDLRGAGRAAGASRSGRGLGPGRCRAPVRRAQRGASSPTAMSSTSRPGWRSTRRSRSFTCARAPPRAPITPAA